MPFRKIINDPVYGFITIDDELINCVIFTHITSACAALIKWQWLIWFIRVPCIQGCIIH